MTYINKFYLNPLKNINTNWKKNCISSLAEIIIAIAIISFIMFSLLNIMSAMNPLADNNLDDKNILAANAFLYSSEMQSFLSTFYLIASIGLIIIFLTYTISRTFIWNYLLNKKNKFSNYLKNIIADTRSTNNIIILFSNKHNKRKHEKYLFHYILLSTSLLFFFITF